MNSKNVMTALVILAAVVLATSAFAANITVAQPMTLNGKQVAPGSYKVVYTGSGSDVQVNLVKGKNTISAPARIEERENKARFDAVVTDEAGGTREVKEILLGGKKQVLVFSGAGGASASMGNR